MEVASRHRPRAAAASDGPGRPDHRGGYRSCALLTQTFAVDALACSGFFPRGPLDAGLTQDASAQVAADVRLMRVGNARKVTEALSMN